MKKTIHRVKIAIKERHTTLSAYLLDASGDHATQVLCVHSYLMQFTLRTALNWLQANHIEAHYNSSA